MQHFKSEINTSSDDRQDNSLDGVHFKCHVANKLFAGNLGLIINCFDNKTHFVAYTQE